LSSTVMPPSPPSRWMAAMRFMLITVPR
jgi:hypothetical protein